MTKKHRKKRQKRRDGAGDERAKKGSRPKRPKPSGYDKWRENIEAIIEGARHQGWELKVGGELFSDAMGAEATYEGTYIGMIKHNVNTIVEALK